MSSSELYLVTMSLALVVLGGSLVAPPLPSALRVLGVGTQWLINRSWNVLIDSILAVALAGAIALAVSAGWIPALLLVFAGLLGF